MDLKMLLAKLKRMWDPRTSLAKEFLDSANKYEETLRANKSINPQIIDAILEEKARILSLFQSLLPEFKERISVVITRDTLVETCAIFSWNNHIYVLVSALLIARPIEHPESNGIKAWEWVAQHEISHLKSGHLPWFFQVRRAFRLTAILLCIPKIFSYLLPSNHLVDSWLNLSFLVFWAVWSVQTIVSLVFEYKADLQATRSIKDPLVLEDGEKFLYRGISQAIKRLPQPLGWLNYLLHSIFLDPHPPFVFRRWLLRKHARLLRNNFTKPLAAINED